MADHLARASTEISHHDIIWLAGPRLIGLVLNWTLLGILSLQVYVYFLNFPQDQRFIKCLVHGIYLIDIIQTCSATYDAFQWFVYGWGNMDVLYERYTSWLNIPVLPSLAGFVVQVLFGWRVWSLSHSHVISGIIIFLALLQLGGAAAVGFYLYTDPSEIDHSLGHTRAAVVRLGSSALVDIVIAGSMTYYLLLSKRKAMGSMNTVLTRLVRLTVETGTMTALAAIIDLIFYVWQGNGLHQVPGVILGKLYTNTLLVLFNSRLLVNKDLRNSDILLGVKMSDQSSSALHQAMHDQFVTVTVDVETSSGV